MNKVFLICDKSKICSSVHPEMINWKCGLKNEEGEIKMSPFHALGYKGPEGLFNSLLMLQLRLFKQFKSVSSIQLNDQILG